MKSYFITYKTDYNGFIFQSIRLLLRVYGGSGVTFFVLGQRLLVIIE